MAILLLSNRLIGLAEEYFRQHNIKLRIVDISTITIEYDYEQSWVSNMVTNILIEVYSSIVENERQTIRQRQS